jgi:hypothetical protein
LREGLLLAAVIGRSRVRLITLRRKKENNTMGKNLYVIATILLIGCINISIADEDARQFVQLPEMMQQHMMSNMRDHLVAINEILTSMTKGDFEKAAEVAEYRLGMSSLESHGASHMAKFMPEEMRQAGTAMHKAASRFALKAQEEEVLPAYNALSEVTSACVACHSGYRIR